MKSNVRVTNIAAGPEEVHKKIMGYVLSEICFPFSNETKKWPPVKTSSFVWTVLSRLSAHCGSSLRAYEPNTETLGRVFHLKRGLTETHSPTSEMAIMNFCSRNPALKLVTAWHWCGCNFSCFVARWARSLPYLVLLCEDAHCEMPREQQQTISVWSNVHE